MSDTENRNDKISALFEDEDIPEILQSNSLAKIELRPSEEALAHQTPRINWEEKREFARAPVEKADLHLKFSSESQFARQYIENISLGGLFVRTQLKPGLGSIIPIDFSVPLNGVVSRFQLKARVSRQSESGLGLQFIDLTDKVRAELEKYIQASLPEGVSVLNPNAKRSSVDRLDQMRDQKIARLRQGRRRIVVAAAITLLIALNAYMARMVLQTEEAIQRAATEQSFELGDEKIRAEDVRSLSRSSNGNKTEFVFHLSSGKEIRIAEEDLHPELLPAHLRTSLNVLRLQQPAKKVRKAINSPKQNSRKNFR